MWTKQNKILALILIVVAIVLAIDQTISSSNGVGNLPESLINAKASDIYSIEFYPKKNIKDKITLKRIGNTWWVIKNNQKYQADTAKIHSLISTLLNLHPTQVVGTNKKDWKQFGTVDTSALNIFVRNKNGRLIAHLLVGKIKTSKSKKISPWASQTFASYVRIDKDRHVYTVPQLLALDFISDVSEYRNHLLMSFPAIDLTRVNISLPNTSFDLLRKNGHWFINNNPADSLQAERFVRDLKRLYGYKFAPDSAAKNLKTLATVTVYLKNKKYATIKGLGDSTITYLWSSLNPKTYFKAEGLKNIIFRKPEFFAKKKSTKANK